MPVADFACEPGILSMNACISRLVLGLAVLGAVAAPAAAGGDYGGLKGYGAVPVPAPIPVPIYKPQWYLRIDASAGFGGDPGAEEDGMVLGDGDGETYRATSPFGTEASWIGSEFRQDAMYGAGAGYRWSDWFRTDLTGESMREVRVQIEGDVTTTGIGLNGLPDPASYNVEVTDTTKVRGAVFLANAYVDIATWGPFTPYVGGGVGFAVARLKRENTLVETTTGPDSTVVSQQTDDAPVDYAFAAAATAGVSYAFSNIVELDVAYRYLFIDSMDVDLVVNGHNSGLTVDATNDHQVRAGLRFNIQ